MIKSGKSGFEALAEETKLYPQEQLATVKSKKKSFYIGIPKEISFQENRVTLTPEAVAILVGRGHDIRIEIRCWGKNQNFLITNTAKPVHRLLNLHNQYMRQT